MYQHLELYEKDYFGLQYYPNGITNDTSNYDNIVSTWNFFCYHERNVYDSLPLPLFCFYLNSDGWIQQKVLKNS